MESERKELPGMEINAMRVSDGLGFGEGTISHQDRIGTEVSAETMNEVEKLLTSPQILVTIEANDDGCGDGREAGIIYEGDALRQRSLNRAKVFGGGATMAVASLVGLGHAGDKNLNEIYDTATGILVDHGIDFGAHSDNLAHGDFSGCGAIDKAPEIISNVTKYQTQIRDTVSALGLDPSGLEDVIRNFSQYSERNISTDYRGADIVENIRRQGRVVKELKDGHNEMYIVLNNVRGKTVNQKKVRDVSDNKVQTFAIDIWRLEDSVEAMYPEEKGFRASDRQKALLAELAYSLATAATLTKGDLPVYITIGQTQAVTV